MKKLQRILLVLMALLIVFSSVACSRGNNSNNNDTSKPEIEQGGDDNQGGETDKPDTDNNDDSLVPQGDPLMKVGVMSDSQLEVGVPSTHSSYHAPEQFRKALNYYKEIGVELLFFMGDMVNNAMSENYELYNSILDEVFPDISKRPEIIYNLGNHERFVGSGTGEAANNSEFTDAQFAKYAKQEQRVHKRINGYSFITIPSMWYNKSDTFDRKSINYLREEVKIAAEEANGKPIFVGMHEPIAGTVYGEGFSAQSASVNGILKKYPNVILFTGHSHFPVTDERSIFQKDYTAINTGSSSSCCLGVSDNGKIKNSYGKIFSNVMTDGSMRPYKNEASGIDAHHQGIGLVVEIYKNVTTIERRNFNVNKRIGELWTIPVETKTSDFIYTDERYDFCDKLPVWDTNHNASVIRDGFNVIVSFDDAHWGSFPVETYEINIMEFGSDEVVNSVCIVSDYFAGLGESKYSVRVPLADKKHSYTCQIIPYDCFNHAGEPYELEIPVA